jgi:hypothetical protein
MVRVIIVIILVFFASSANATHCDEPLDIIDKVSVANPGSVVLVKYEGVNALSYIDSLNIYPHGQGYIVGDMVVVIGNPMYKTVFATTFHYGCLAIAVLISKARHEIWVKRIEGTGL